jgi:hypothetical protein
MVFELVMPLGEKEGKGGFLRYFGKRVRNSLTK